jgi:hypothetical protein
MACSTKQRTAKNRQINSKINLWQNSQQQQQQQQQQVLLF